MESQEVEENPRLGVEGASARDFAATVLDTAGSLVIVLDRQFRIVRFNRACQRLTGYSWEEVRNRDFVDLLLAPEEKADVLAAKADVLAAAEELTAGHSPSSFENFWVTKSGERRLIAWENTVLLDREGKPEFLVGTGIDITERRRVEDLASGQARVMEMIASAAPLTTVLEEIVRFLESQSLGMSGSIVLLDEDGVHMRHAASPSLPREYRDAVDGLEIGEAVGSCGTAMFRREAVMVADISTDPLWAGFHELAARLGLRASWSAPIFAADGRILGAFAMFYGVPHEAKPDDGHLIQVALHLAGIAIEREHGVESLRAVAARNDQLAQVINSLSTGIIIAAPNYPDNPITFCNAGFTEMTGYEESEIIGRNCRFLQGPDTDPAAVRQIRESLIAGRRLKVVLLNYRKDGTSFYNELTLSPVYDEAGELRQFVGLQVDVSERTKLDKALEQQKTQLNEAQRIAHLGNWHRPLSPGGVWWSDELFRIFGIEKTPGSQVLYRTVLRRIHRDDRRRVQSVVDRALADLQPFSVTHRVVRPDGDERIVDCRGIVILDEAGRAVGMYGTTQDITDLRQTELALHESEARFQNIVANVPGMVYQWILHPDGSTEWPFVSEGCRDIYDVSPEEIRRRPQVPLEAIHADDRPGFEAKVAESARTLEAWYWEGRLVFPKGQTKWIQAASRPQRLGDDATLWDGVVLDITARKEAEQELQRANEELESRVQRRTGELRSTNLKLEKELGERRRLQERLQLQNERMPMGRIVWDMDSRVVSWNPAATRIFGYSAEEAIGMSGQVLMPPEIAPHLAEQWNDLMQGKDSSPSINDNVTRDGRIITCEWSNISLRRESDGAVAGVLSLLQDVTEREKAERDNAEQMRLAVLSADIGVSLTRSKSLPEMLQSCADALVQHLDVASVRIWTWIEHEQVLALQAASGMSTHAGGRDQQISMGEGEIGLIAQTRRAHMTNDVRSDPRISDREWVEKTGVSAFAGFPMIVDENLMGVVALFSLPPLSDVTLQSVASVANSIALGTERKCAEEELREAKEEADRANLAKSEFLSRMSHELRTPLNAILGFSQVLELEDLGPLARESAQHILKGGRHLLDLINEVLDIALVEAGRMQLSLEPVLAEDVVSESISLAQPLARQRDIEIIRIEPLPWGEHVIADRQRLKQVLINLLGNAIKYNRPGGRVTLTCRAVEVSSADSDSPLGRFRISIADTGPGISESDLKKLFTPFERLNAGAEAEGTGLGLALSQRLIHEMKGSLDVESTPGQGSTFTVELPMSKSPLQNMIEAPAEVENPAPASIIAHTILSIEDNLSNHRLIEAILGHRPNVRLLGAMQGLMGLEMAREHSPDLILLDLHLPDIMGQEVLMRLRDSPQTRDIPVVICSADATEPQIQRLLNAGAQAYLTKPLNVKEFLKTINDLLEPI